MDREEVKKLADLARISLDEEEIDGYIGDFKSILGYVDSIQKIDGLDDLHPEFFNKNVVREDLANDEPGKYSQDILAEAPETSDGYFKVGKIL